MGRRHRRRRRLESARRSFILSDWCDSEGNILSDSSQGSQYLGPRHVMDDIRSMVK